MSKKVTKLLAVLTGFSLLAAIPGPPAYTVSAKAAPVSSGSPSPELRNINLNVIQEDGSYATAGISDPGQPANSQLEPAVSRTNNWGEEKNAQGEVIKSGSFIYYGSYCQSSDGGGGYHTEPVKWRVLDADTQNFSTPDDTASHTMFLMADKVLEQVNFNESKNDGGIYSTSNLRKWLNSESFQGPYPEGGFLNNAFSGPERKGIAISRKSPNQEIEIKTLVKDNCGLSQDGLTDRIFVLSAEEANSNHYGFFYMNGWGASNTRLLSATDYAKDKGICSATLDWKDWWLRSQVTDSSFSAGLADCTGWLWAGNVDGRYSDGQLALVGVAPAFNMDLSRVTFTSAAGTDKVSSFAATSAGSSREWNLTMAGGSGFQAERKGNESGAVTPGGEINIDISRIGTSDSGVEYSQISAMLVDKNNSVAAYGRIAGPDASQASLTIPPGTPDGDYILKVFEEDVNSSAHRNLTDFASNMADIPITVGDTYTIIITNPADSHISHTTAADNGTEKQGVPKDGGSYAPVIYTADNGYYFPEDYHMAESNGIRVTRNSTRQITVSGAPTGDVSLTLMAAAEKDRQPAPEGLDEAEGEITGTDSTMEYRAKPAAEDDSGTKWTDCTADAIAVKPGIWQIRYKETETKKAGAIAEITVYARYTVVVTNPAGSHIVLSDAAGNGESQQKTVDGRAITPIQYTAEEGYYFPDHYSVTGQNGITVTRDGAGQITVSGVPTGDARLTLTAAEKKPDPAPTPGSPSEPAPGPKPEPVPSPDPSPDPPVTIQKPDKKQEEGYDIFAAPCGKKLSAKSLIQTVKGKKTFTSLAKAAAKKMTGRKSYKIRIKAYKITGGRKVYQKSSPVYHVAGAKNKSYTNAKKITVSKKKVILKKGASGRIKAKIIKQSKKKKLLPRSHGASLRYRSANTKIAAVSKEGKIKAKKKGVSYIYITALNGVTARIKVRVI